MSFLTNMPQHGKNSIFHPFVRSWIRTRHQRRLLLLPQFHMKGDVIYTLTALLNLWNVNFVFRCPCTVGVSMAVVMRLLIRVTWRPASCIAFTHRWLDHLSLPRCRFLPFFLQAPTQDATASLGKSENADTGEGAAEQHYCKWIMWKGGTWPRLGQSISDGGP